MHRIESAIINESLARFRISRLASGMKYSWQKKGMEFDKTHLSMIKEKALFAWQLFAPGE